MNDKKSHKTLKANKVTSTHQQILPNTSRVNNKLYPLIHSNSMCHQYKSE